MYSEIYASRFKTIKKRINHIIAFKLAHNIIFLILNSDNFYLFLQYTMDIDSLAHGLDRLTSTVDYRAAIECLDAACRSESGHIEAQFDKIATKLLASVSKMMESRADFHPYGLLMIKAIVCNCSKSVRVSNHTIIMRLTETYLCHSAAEGCVDELEVSEAATFTLAVLHSTEGAAAWGRIFQRYVDGCLALLSVQLGVETTASAGGSKGAVDKFHFSNLPQTVAMSSLDLSSAYGPRKAYVVSRLFSGYCRVLQRMLATGCSTGPVVVPMPGFLELCHVCLHTISSPRHVSAHVAKVRSLLVLPAPAFNYVWI